MKLFIFDWSGVISDDRKPVYEANMRIFDENGVSRMTFDEFLSKTDLTVAEFLASKGIAGTPEELFLLYEQYLGLITKKGIKPKIYPDVKGILDFLSNRNKYLAVLSSHPEINLQQEARNYGIDSYFRLIMGNSRDKSAGLIQIITTIGVEPQETIYLGDMTFDIRAAKKAGVKSGAVVGAENNQRGYHSRQRLENELPDFVLTTLDDLKDLI